jgi:hypothetical protein
MMKAPAAVALIASVGAHAQAPYVTLDALRDHQRVLLIFSNGDNRLAEAQLNVAASNASGFRERDLILVGLAGSMPDVPTALLSSADDVAARKRFHVAAGQFTVILIGKDGGEKLRSDHPIAWKTLQQTIDSMPMRQSEMKITGR